MTSSSKKLYGYNLFLAWLTLILIGAGGLVTSHQAGLSVPDWPLSYGQVFPPMHGLMIWEHSHRVIAGVVAILTVIFTLWVTFQEKRKGLILAAWFSLGLVFLQALLGGLTVLLKLPHAVSMSHGVIAQTFLACLVSIAFFMSPYYERVQNASPALRDRKQIRLVISCLAFVYLQIILGAFVRHAGKATIEHVVFALAVAGHLMALAFYVVYKHSENKTLIGLVIRVAAVVTIQIFFGIGALTYRLLVPATAVPPVGKVVFTVLHQTTGAVLLFLVVLIGLVSLFPDPARTIKN